MKPSINKAATDPVYFCFNHVQGGSHLTIQNATGADLTIEVTNQNAQQLGVSGVTWSSPAQGDLVIAAGDNATLLAPYAFVKLSGTGTGDIHLAYAEKDDEDDLAVYATPSGATLFASFVGEIYYISGEYGDFNFPFDITRSSSKYVWGTGAQTGQLIEVPPNTPAYQHDPVTGAPLGLSVEGSATNHVSHSSNFTNAAWDKFRLSVESSTEPSLLTGKTLEKLVENTDNLSHAIGQPAITSSGTITKYWVVKPNGRRYVQLSFSGSASASAYANFDIQDGVVGAFADCTPFIEPLPLGLYKVGVTATVNAGSAFLFIVNSLTAARSESYQGDGVSGVYADFSQLETGTVPTSYIPTTTSTATRSADIVTSDAATFGDWYRTSGTLIVTAKANVGDLVARLGNIDIIADVDTEKTYSVTYTTDPLATGLELLPSGNGYIKEVTFKE